MKTVEFKKLNSYIKTIAFFSKFIFVLKVLMFYPLIFFLCIFALPYLYFNKYVFKSLESEALIEEFFNFIFLKDFIKTLKEEDFMIKCKNCGKTHHIYFNEYQKKNIKVKNAKEWFISYCKYCDF